MAGTLFENNVAFVSCICFLCDSYLQLVHSIGLIATCRQSEAEEHPVWRQQTLHTLCTQSTVLLYIWKL